MLTILLFQFNNATRPLEIGYKAEEWRNFALFYFPIIVDCLKSIDHKRECQIWQITSFLLRSVSLPEREFQRISPLYLQEQLSKWYKLWSRIFGDFNLVYNVHMVWVLSCRSLPNMIVTFYISSTVWGSPTGSSTTGSSERAQCLHVRRNVCKA